MTVTSSRRPRVLLGNLEPVMRLGMSRVLAEGGIEVLTEDGQPLVIMTCVRDLDPDAVVLGFDRGRSSDLSERMRAAVPDTKLIFVARDEGQIEVFDPGSAAPRVIRTEVSNALLSELSVRQGNREEE